MDNFKISSFYKLLILIFIFIFVFIDLFRQLNS